jgi:predicted XRE-type DNA-binding protein
VESKGSSKARPPRLTQGSVLDDLGFTPSEALEIKVKAEIYRELLGFIQKKAFTQQELSDVLGIHQPDVSNLLNGRVSKFSVSKLIRLAGKLNLGAKVKLTMPKVQPPAAAYISRKPSKRLTALTK